MSKIIATIHMLGIDLVESAKARLATAPDHDPERGSVSVEQVVITAALLIAAIALVAIIGNAIANRAQQIT